MLGRLDLKPGPLLCVWLSGLGLFMTRAERGPTATDRDERRDRALHNPVNSYAHKTWLTHICVALKHHKHTADKGMEISPMTSHQKLWVQGSFPVACSLTHFYSLMEKREYCGEDAGPRNLYN